MRPCPEFYGNDARPTPAAAPQLLTPNFAGLAWFSPREPDEASASECPREGRQPPRALLLGATLDSRRSMHYWECPLQVASTLATPSSDMEYFFYCRAKPDSEALWAQLTEAHWLFMERYADAMIARGPTLAADRATATGSMHMVELPDAAAARVFAFEEPCYVAGVYSEVMVRRCRNALGRTMWEFDGDAVANRRFLVIGHGSPDTNAVGSALRAAQRRYFVDGGYLERMIARGPLLSDDGREWVGDATLIELRDRAAVEAMLASAPFIRAGLYANVEVHDWEFGGRR